MAGKSAGTAAWATNVGNEFGQVLMTVLTASEGSGLQEMATGIVRRYQQAGVSPPVLLYTDRDCCGERPLGSLFEAWPQLRIRLDTWPFMRRIAIGCTTESHPLYGVFMARLSQCIFEWSEDDLQQLKRAKTAELIAAGISNPSDDDVFNRLSRKELALHCRRRTRGIEATVTRIEDLLTTFMGPQGSDTLGVALLDIDRMWGIWDIQKRHVPCIQDVGALTLYTRTGSLTKGGIELPTYRCARGSTSLESFHKHLNFFIPGKYIFVFKKKKRILAEFNFFIILFDRDQCK